MNVYAWVIALSGAATLLTSAPGSAAVLRLDPGLKSTRPPLFTDVQFQGGPDFRKFPQTRVPRPGGFVNRGAIPAQGGLTIQGAPPPNRAFSNGGGFAGGQEPNRFGNRGGPGPDQGGYGGGYRHRHRDDGIGAGVAGLAAGALIGGAIGSQSYPGYGYGYDSPDESYEPAPDYAPGYAYAPEPAGDSDDSQAYCVQRFKSYDPSSGTYLGYDGLRHPCP